MSIVIVGLNNPQSSDPGLALYPHNAKATGWKLWGMANDVCEITRIEWLCRVRRVNLLTDTVLPRDYRRAARRRAIILNALLEENHTVIMLGSEVAGAFSHRDPPFVWNGNRVAIPHPSGRNRYYNDPVVRVATGVLLHDVLEMHGLASGS